MFLEPQDDLGVEGWREKSGAVIRPEPVGLVAPENDLINIWHPEYLRVFLSHKASHKILASELKTATELYGVSCFVAHEDIEPTREWQREIEKALFSMEALVALITPDFADSNWTDQELGVAIGRRVPIIPVRLGKDPYGFVGKYQGLQGLNRDPASLGRALYDLLLANPTLISRLTESLVARFEKSLSFAHANTLMRLLAGIKSAPPHLIERIEKAPAQNDQVAGAYTVREELPKLLARLRRRRG